MYHPTVDEVKVLAAKGNLVPIWKRIPADLETPVSVYLKLRKNGPSFLLESVEKGEQIGRYSFIGVKPAGTLIAAAGKVSLWEDGEVQELDAAGGIP